MTVTDAAPAPTTAAGPGGHDTALRDAAEAVLEVLCCFAEDRPDDERPRAAVESVLGWLDGRCDDEQVAAAGRAAHSAAREATAPAAVSAARAAAQLAAATRSPGQLPQARRYADRARTARRLAARSS
jgi:hypothetical protein